MNEQQLADLFSNQLDSLLQGEAPVLPPEASDLQELLDFGQQFSQITFQPRPMAQAAFQGQLASWFGPAANSVATILGISKPLFFTIIAAVILVGTGAGLAVLGSFSSDDSDGLSAPEAPVLPASTSESAPESPAVDSESETIPRTPQSSLEEVIPGGGSSSLGDTVPTSPSSMGDTLTLPPLEPTATAEDDVDTHVSSGESVTSDRDGTDSDSIDGEDTQEGDHDKGHGNDEDRIDEDNPGNSGPGNDSQSSGLGGVGRGDDDNGGGQGGNGGNGSQGGGKGKGQGGGKGKGQNNQ